MSVGKNKRVEEFEALVEKACNCKSDCSSVISDVNYAMQDAKDASKLKKTGFAITKEGTIDNRIRKTDVERVKKATIRFLKECQNQ